MNIRIQRLRINLKKSIRTIGFSQKATFIFGPISKGKSTVARLVDFCFGGKLEETPAIQSEFVSAELSVQLGEFDCYLERSLTDSGSVTVSWIGEGGMPYTVNAPLQGAKESIIGDEVFNFSDLVFYLCGETPIKVRKSRTDPDSDLIRLSIRDVWRFCYLDQAHLDSSFFRMEDPFRRRKSQDAMRFFTGLHSDRLNQLEADLAKERDDERGKRRAASEIRNFISRFGLGTDVELAGELGQLRSSIVEKKGQRTELESIRLAETHPVDGLRSQLTDLSYEIENIRSALRDSELSIHQQSSLRQQIITAKLKASRDLAAQEILQPLSFKKCPECETDIEHRPVLPKHCRLCGSSVVTTSPERAKEAEAVRRDFNTRAKELNESIERRKAYLERLESDLSEALEKKRLLDKKLQVQLRNYDSAYVETVRELDAEIAQLEEKTSSLQKFLDMSDAIASLEEEADQSVAKLQKIQRDLVKERDRLNRADSFIKKISEEFKSLLLRTSFPGVSSEDRVEIDSRNWKPKIGHEGQEWSFWDAGSGGKKTLFNVLYALALHKVSLEEGLPLPNFLVIDSPTKNISDDENPELVASLFKEIYSLARIEHGLQLLLIDSDLVLPDPEIPEFSHIRMAGVPDAPSLIDYYEGP